MSDDDNKVPQSPEHYRPEFEKRPHFPDNIGIDDKNPRYIAAAKAAHEAGLTQKQFSKLLAHEIESEVQRRAREQKNAAPPKPEPQRTEPAKIPGYDKMTMAQKLAAAGHR